MAFRSQADSRISGDLGELECGRDGTTRAMSSGRAGGGAALRADPPTDGASVRSTDAFQETSLLSVFGSQRFVLGSKYVVVVNHDVPPGAAFEKT